MPLQRKSASPPGEGISSTESTTDILDDIVLISRRIAHIKGSWEFHG